MRIYHFTSEATKGSVGAPAASRQARTSDAVISPQLKAFATMIDEPEATVLQRLASHPDLMPLALAAGEARLNRKRLGKIATITGFSIVGVGVSAGLALVVSGIPGYCSNEGCNSNDNRIQLGFLVAAFGTGIGLALGIPGIVRMASQSSLENEAVARYQGTEADSVERRPAAPAISSLRGQPPARVVSWPLLSFAF